MSALDDLLQSRGIGSPAVKAAALSARSKGPAEAPKTPGSCRIYDCVQGTTEWLALRAGIPTASNFDRIVTPGGKPSKSAEKYMLHLLAERLIGEPIEDRGYSHWMDRGSEMEAEAVNFYEFQRDVETVKVGFVTNEAGTVGASPDRFVGDKGLLEIKAPSEAIHMGYLLQTGSAYKEYRVQVQGQLWVCEREWSDTESYHPQLPEALYRVERDEPFIELLAAGVTAFTEVLEQQFQICVQRGWVAKKPKPQTKQAIDPLPPLSELVKSALLEMQK